MARYPRDVFPNGALQGILNTWGAYLAKTSSFRMHGGDILPRKGVFPVRGSFGNALGRNFARTVAFRVIRVRFEGVSFEGCAFVCPRWVSKTFRPRMRPLACSGMLFKDASSRTLRLHRRTKDDYCPALSTPACLLRCRELWAMRCCGASGTDVAVDANGGGAGGA